MWGVGKGRTQYVYKDSEERITPKGWEGYEGLKEEVRTELGFEGWVRAW